MISKTWQGYEISRRRKGTEFKLYVKSIYKGKITWTTDYTHAKHYTEKTAKRLDAEIDEGIRNGEFDNDILADSEVQELPEVEEVVEEQKPEADEPTTKLLASRNDKTLPLECINDLIKAYEELTHRTIEIVFKRNGTYRIFALSNEGNAIADWTNASDMIEHMTKFVEA